MSKLLHNHDNDENKDNAKVKPLPNDKFWTIPNCKSLYMTIQV